MKTTKSYRLSPKTIKQLEELKEILKDWTETDIIENSIEQYYWREKYENHVQ